MYAFLTLTHPESVDEIVELRNFIGEHNLKGIIPKVTEVEPEKGTMTGYDYQPIIQMVLGSAAVAAGVKGFFDILKNYFELKKQKIIANSKLDELRSQQGKIQCTIESSDSKKLLHMEFYSFDEQERKAFFAKIDDLMKGSRE